MMVTIKEAVTKQSVRTSVCPCDCGGSNIDQPATRYEVSRRTHADLRRHDSGQLLRHIRDATRWRGDFAPDRANLCPAIDVTAHAVWCALLRLQAAAVPQLAGSHTQVHRCGSHRDLVAMGISGALAGLLAVNELSGVQGKLTLDFVAGAGFTGIAVSLMGRNHPVGILLAALLFGVLYQGGVEVAFELPGFSREMVVTVQGLIVLFAGAMSMVSAPLFAKVYAKLKGGRHG